MPTPLGHGWERAHAAASQDLARAILQALALEGYRNGQFSESVVRRLFGFDTRLEVHAFLADHDVPLNYSLESLDPKIRIGQA